MSALARMKLPPTFIKVIGSLYEQPMCKVEMDGWESLWHEQQTGITQGCPLSPYFFILLVRVIFSDVQARTGAQMARHRIVGTDFDFVCYADDTICASESTRAMSILLKEVEIEGAKIRDEIE